MIGPSCFDDKPDHTCPANAGPRSPRTTSRLQETGKGRGVARGEHQAGKTLLCPIPPTSTLSTEPSTQAHPAKWRVFADIPFAAIKLTLLEMDHAEDAYTFVDTCDSHSQYLYTVAYTLDQSWHIEDHAQGDAYLIVDSIVIDPEYGGDGRMKALLADALPLLCPDP